MSNLVNFPERVAKSMLGSFQVEPVEHPSVTVMRDVVALPNYDSLYFSTGQRIDESKRVNLPKLGVSEAVRRWVTTTNDDKYEPAHVAIPNRLEVIDKPVMFLGSIWPHYGHFLMDGMARLWAVDTSLVDFLLLDRADKNFLNNRFISPILKRYQAGYSGAFVTVDKPTLFRHVKVPSASVEYAIKIFKCHQRAHVEFANATLATHSTERFADRVYLSRSALSEKLRHVANEDILERALAKNGYTIVYPERLSLEEQLKIFNTAKWVVGTIGSAFHTSLFSTESFAGSLAILSWSKINRRYLMIDAIKGNRSTYINCISTDEIDDRRRIQKTSLKADVALDALSSIGAI